MTAPDHPGVLLLATLDAMGMTQARLANHLHMSPKHVNQVCHGGVKDLDAKARIESAMDERRTGEDGYRRGITEAREQNPQRPGRPIEPFGYSKSEEKALLSDGAAQRRGYRPPLGKAVRRYTNTDGRTSLAPARESMPRWMQLRNSAERLSDPDLGELLDALKAEQRRRRKRDP